MTDRLLIVRIDEISIKGRNRRQFENQLVQNLARALDIPGTKVQREQGLVYVEIDPGRDAVVRAVERVFGVKTFSPATRIQHSVEEMLALGIGLAREERSAGAQTFKVRTRRALKSFHMDSAEINRYLGRAITESVSDLTVDVHTPDFRLGVDVRETGILMWTRLYQGPGGLPVGTGGKALLLLSGGIDSPVAGWMAMKRGLSVDAVYYHSPPFTSERAKEKVFELARILSRWKTGPLTIYVVPLSEIQTDTSKVIQSKFWTLIHRRFMHRLAERIATASGYDALVTGESIGQVASQTLRNIGVIEQAVGMLVLRPLTGFDKLEIITQAKHIGTFETSLLPYDDCCTLFAPSDPATSASVERVVAVEAALDIVGLMERALKKTEVYSVSEQGIEQPEHHPMTS